MRPIHLLGVAVLVGALHGTLASTAAAVPITTLFSTGVDALGVPLADAATDPHYSVNGGAAFIVGVPSSVGWVGNTPSSAWITPLVGTRAGGGPFTYHTTFDLSGFDPGTASIAGSIAADDEAVILLNGVPVFATHPTADEPWTFLDPFTITAGFVAGANTLDIVVPNNIVGANDGPTGLQLDLVGNVGAVPEPGMIGVLGLGLLGLAAVRRSR